MSRIWMSQVTHVDESFHTLMNVSCHMYGCITSHVEPLSLTYMLNILVTEDESCHTYG